MTSTTIDHLRSGLRKLRRSIGGRHRDRSGERSPASGTPADPRGPAATRGRAVPSRLTIRDVMEGDLATVRPDCPIASAVALMIEHRISSVPVVDAAGHIVGALNERDLMKVFYLPETECVEEVMTRKPIVVSEDSALVDVIDHLMSSDFRRVLIHRQEQLVGVITRSHVMPALLAALEERARARAPRGPLH